MLFFKWTLGFCVLIFQLAEAVTSSEVFAKFPNHYFVETGSYTGNGIMMALQAGFPVIYSVELAPHHYQQCCARFANYPNVHLFFGDSSTELARMLKEIDAPATFWLDGHFSSGTTAKGLSNTPILIELEAIRNHPIKTHTILIDDIRQCGTEDFDFINLSQLILSLKKINPDYEISFENGYVINDVLVARIHNK